MTSILATGQAAGTIGMVVWFVVLFAVMYFLMIRPQKKEQKKKAVSYTHLDVYKRQTVSLKAQCLRLWMHRDC